MTIATGTRLGPYEILAWPGRVGVGVRGRAREKECFTYVRTCTTVM